MCGWPAIYTWYGHDKSKFNTAGDCDQTWPIKQKKKHELEPCYDFCFYFQYLELYLGKKGSNMVDPGQNTMVDHVFGVKQDKWNKK